MVEAGSRWNNGADVHSPSRRGPLGRRRWASGVGCLPIYGSGSFWCSGCGRGGGGDDYGVELCPLAPAPRRCGELRPHRGVPRGVFGASATCARLGLLWLAVVAGGGAAVAAFVQLGTVLVFSFFASSPAGRAGVGWSLRVLIFWSREAWCSTRALGSLARWRCFWHGLAVPATAAGAGAGRRGGLAVLLHRLNLVACGEWLMRSSSMLKVFPLPGGWRFGFFFSDVRRRRRSLVVQQLLSAVVLFVEFHLYDLASVLFLCFC